MSLMCLALSLYPIALFLMTPHFASQRALFALFDHHFNPSIVTLARQVSFQGSHAGHAVAPAYILLPSSPCLPANQVIRVLSLGQPPTHDDIVPIIHVL